MDNYRKRFINTMLFKDVHTVPFHEVGLWGQTLERWEKEGLPKGSVPNLLFFEGNKYFGFEPKEYIKINSTGPLPEFEYKVLEENDRIIVYSDTTGVTRKALKEGTAHGMRYCMDQYISFPIKDSDTFNDMRKRYEANISNRYPSNWDELVKHWKSRSFPLILLGNGQFGFYSMLRTWMGTEGVSYIFYDDPELVRRMLDFMADYIIELTHKALHELDIDCFNFWEDMSFKNGPLVSPKMFRELFLPPYKRVIDHLRSHGIMLVTVDTDGDPRLLLPLFIEAGVNGYWPIEVAAGINPVMLREEYGKDLALMGGIDKRILSGSKEGIYEEVMKILDYMLPKGGYIPTVDHTIPPDVSLENFLYYLEIKKRALEGKI